MTEHVTDSTHSEHYSLWAPVLGLSTVFIGLGLSYIFNKEKSTALGFVFITIFLAVFIAFSIYEIRNRVNNPDYGMFKDESHLTTKIPKHTWMWLFLSSEVIFFILIIGISFALRLAVDPALGFTASTGYLFNKEFLFAYGDQQIYQGWVDDHGKGPSEVLDIIVTSINTFILITSSFTMVKAHEASVAKDSLKTRNWLAATAAIGLVFLSVQVFEYSALLNEGFTPASGLFGATFFLQTGFHGAHVLVGIVLVSLMAYKAHIGGFDKDGSDVEVVGLYWHFVDVVWIILFTLVYLV
ncbi:MAG: heme-copper oxidase subunit III [Candidatus Heimdallarchaeota archaeon]|nr:heme-copper oxidase subunit III [Candidatus Heimdallarchaeota archaeon]